MKIKDEWVIRLQTGNQMLRESDYPSPFGRVCGKRAASGEKSSEGCTVTQKIKQDGDRNCVLSPSLPVLKAHITGAAREASAVLLFPAAGNVGRTRQGNANQNQRGDGGGGSRQACTGFGQRARRGSGDGTGSRIGH